LYTLAKPPSSCAAAPSHPSFHVVYCGTPL
jgi:hypothetical protein